MKLKKKEISNWNEMASISPWWTVLNLDKYKSDDFEKKEFFKTGEKEIELVMQHLKELKIRWKSDNLLDFGCGVGRLTQALCPHFKHCTGVDISDKMIEVANRFNRYPDRCTYLVNQKDDLKLFSDNQFDIIYSSIVLQHIKKGLIYRYFKEFVRIMKPGGLFVFQLPYKPFFKKRVKNIIKKVVPNLFLNIYRKMRTKTTAHSNMCWIPARKIKRFFDEQKAELINKIPFTLYQQNDYYSYLYVIRKL
ncbi:MAG: class I SAM-dependent methyltransferase [Spirochaetes bacterium]|nr:class I SAM-dependent methyltransferase [Spirochaetota bacterium]